jgi:hypothetical protein
MVKTIEVIGRFVVNDFLRDQQLKTDILEHITEDYDPNTKADVVPGTILFQDWLESIGVHEAVKVVRELMFETEDASLKACLEAVLDEVKMETTHEFHSAFMTNMCGYSFQLFVEEVIAKRIAD